MKLLSSLAHKLLLRKTSFPELLDDDADESVPGLAALEESGDISSDSDEESVERRRQEYHQKEEQDVAVFLEISQRLSSESLLFLLQNHARTVLYNNIPPAQLDAVLQQQSKQRQETTAATEKKIPKRIQHFRFAVVTHDQVRAVVHEIPRNDVPDDGVVHQCLWWTREEYAATKTEAAQLARFYRRHEPAFLQRLAVLARVESDPEEVQQNLQALFRLNYAHPTRGLETHMARLLSAPRKRIVQAVLMEQQNLRSRVEDESKSDDGDDHAEHLRQVSLAQSASNRAFARRMGDYDQMEALQAIASRWRRSEINPPPPIREGAIRAAAVQRLSLSPSEESSPS